MSFIIRNLTGDRVSVKGQDVDGVDGETVLDARQWRELEQRAQVKEATAEFDAAVEAFYAPLIKAAEATKKSFERPEDSISFIVLDEGEEPVAGRAPQVVHLNKDSVVLRILESGNTDRLIWVDGSLEVLEVLPGTSGAGTTPSFDEVVAQAEALSEVNPEN